MAYGVVFTSVNVGINWGGFLDVVTLLYYFDTHKRKKTGFFFSATLETGRETTYTQTEQAEYRSVWTMSKYME